MPSLQSEVMLILSHTHKGFDQEAVPTFMAQEEKRLLQASVVWQKEKISMNYKDQNQDHKIFHRDHILSRDVRSLIRFASAFGLCQ